MKAERDYHLKLSEDREGELKGHEIKMSAQEEVIS